MGGGYIEQGDVIQNSIKLYKIGEGGGPGPDQYFYTPRYRYRNKKAGIKYLLLYLNSA